MTKRNTSRKFAAFALYQAEIRQKDITDILTDYLEDRRILPDTKNFADELALKAWKNQKASDEIIIKYAKNWEFSRINALDKCILRLALYEIRFTETPVKIVLNEAIEIAKKYSSDDAPKFINGILNAFIKQECLLV